MSEAATTTLSSKGQVVIPEEIRSRLGLKTGAQFVVVAAIMVDARPLPRRVGEDPDDEMFLAAALASHTRIIVSGDKGLLAVSGWRGIEVRTPRQFHDEYLARVDS